MVIGGKWKPKILFYLGNNEMIRFGQLRDDIGEISEKMLIQNLRELEKDGIVHREVYKQVPPKVEYSLTEMGRTLIPILENLFCWGQQYASFLLSCGGECSVKPGEILDDIEQRVEIQEESG
jgi:DNA-binding HxlR family transcriptional regulator